MTGPSGGRGRVMLAGGGLVRERKLSNLMRGGAKGWRDQLYGYGHSV